MVVMDTDSGKMLNYRQLIPHPKYKKGWCISPANEFGQLANEISGCIKGTNAIKVIHVEDVPRDRIKDVTYGQCVRSV